MTHKTRLRSLFAVLALALLPVLAALGQPVSPFYQAVTGLNPVAYWPLQETVAPPMADVETNLGTLGAVANAYYSSTNIVKGFWPGAIYGSSDTAVSFRTNANSGSFLAVPNLDRRVSLQAGQPFSVEAWIYPTNFIACTIAAQTGAGSNPGLNTTANAGGWSLHQSFIPSLPGAPFLPGISFHVYNGVGTTGGAEAVFAAPVLTPAWYHIVAVFDGVNATLYVNGTNGSPAGYQIPMAGAFLPDTWDPITIGGGGGVAPSRPYSGAIDEVAIYGKALTPAQIANHFYQGTSGGDAGYVSAISTDGPLMWWRMNAAPVAAPAVTDYPVAANYGSSIKSTGLYLQGTTPGVPGPALPGMGATSLACAFNGLGTAATNFVPMFSNSVAAGSALATSGVLITNLDPLLNLKASNISYVCWFKGNPWDNRFQALFGRGNSLWRLAVNGSGGVQANPGTGSDVSTASGRRFNDGNWHFAAVVYTNAGTATTAAGTDYLYIDGVLESTFSPGTSTATPSSQFLVLGGAPDYVRNGNGGSYNQRFFAGSLAHVAYFTNCLTAAQIVNLYTNATGGATPPPVITSQPYPYPGVRNVVGGPGVFIYEGVVAVGCPPLSYQWFYNTSSNYTGATQLADDPVKYAFSATSQITITNLADADSGYYFTVVTDAYGKSATSSIVNVKVNTEPLLTAQNPAGALTLFPNQSATLSVTATGTTNLVYQWFTNNVADPTGTNATYPVSNVQQAMSGFSYLCVVTNSYGAATSAPVTLTVTPFPAQLATSAYSSNLLATLPTAYWPMHESGQVLPPADVETNYGTLGNVANAYYGDWKANNGAPGNTVIAHQIGGALAGDANPCALFTGAGGSYAVIPRTSPLTTLKPPFTLEAWVKPYNNVGFGVILSVGNLTASRGLNGGPNQGGFDWLWCGTPNTFSITVRNGNGTTSTEPKTTANYYPGQWYHLVTTFDGTNIAYYINGIQDSLQNSPAATMAPNTWDPITIGAGRWTGTGNNRFYGAIDELAVYTNLLSLSDIQQHYNDGLSTTANYKQDVLANNPLLYYRMDSPPYTEPPLSQWAVLTNYGATANNGVYRPGAVPGGGPGPAALGIPAPGFGANSALVLDGNSIFADAGFVPAFNPQGTTPFSVAAWVKGNPADIAERNWQSLVSHSDNAWRLNMNSGNGRASFNSGGTGGSDLGNNAATPTINDGNWHYVVGTYDGATSRLWVDGQLGATNTGSTALGSSGVDVFLGGYPSGSVTNDMATETRNESNRMLAGSLCEAAFWNGTALSSNQVYALYNAAAIAPAITLQPVSTTNNAGVNYTNTMAANGALPLSYQWYQNGSPLADQTNSSLIYNPIVGANAGTYYAVVTNNYGAVTSAVVSVTVYTTPVFTLQPSPAAITLYAGGSASFSVATVGAAPIFYYWLSNNVALASATNTSYSFTNAQASAVYTCLASNYLGQTTSSAVTVTVLPRPSAAYPALVLADNPVGYWRLNEPDDNAGNNGKPAHDYWGGNNGSYLNTVLGQPGYGSGLASQFQYANATDPVTAAQFGYYAAGSSNLVLGISGIDFSAPTNHSGAFSIEAWANGDATQSYTAGIVTKGAWGLEQFTLDTGGTSHAYRFTTRDSGTAIKMLTSNTNFPDGYWHHLVGVLDQAHSNACFYVDGIKVASTTCSPSNGVLSTSVPMSIGSRLGSGSVGFNQQFFGSINDVAVYNYALSTTQVVNHYLAAGIPPRFTAQLISATNVNEGTTLIIPTQVLGSPTLAYQWFDTPPGGSPTPIAGQTGSTLVLNNIRAAAYDTHTLSVTVTNSYGQVTSSGVYVTVAAGAPSAVTVNPQTLSVYAGLPVVFTATAQGTQPFTYQWTVDGTTIASATTSTYTNVAALNQHTIGCTVRNSVGIGSPAPATATITGVAAPSDNYALGILNDKPLAYWRLDEALNATTANDFVGGHNASYYSATNGLPGFSPVNSDTAAGFGFNGVASYSLALETDNSYSGVPTIDFSSQGPNAQFSIEAWVNAPSGQPSGAGIVTKGYGSGGEQFDLDIYGNNFRFFVRDAAGGVHGPTTSIKADGTWHHLVGVCDEVNGTVTLYIDSVVRGVSAITPGLGLLGSLPAGSAVLTSIGARQKNSTDGSYAFQLTNTVVDEVAIYNYALSSNQVVAHYVAAAEPAQILADPSSPVYAYYGFPLSLSVVASGSPTLYYQWQKNNANLTDGGTLSGAHTDTLNLSAATLADSGSYRVIVTNATGSDTSLVASVTVQTRLGFNGLGNAWSGNSTTNVVPKFNAANQLLLTDGSKNEASSSFFNYPVYIGGFQASFTYQDVGGGGADGIAFVVQNDARGAAALGGGGGGFGYNGITNSAALEFNIYASNTVGYGLRTNGATGGPYVSALPVNLASGNPINVALQYAGGQLTMSLQDTVANTSFTVTTNVDIPTAVGGYLAYVGFTGADGGTASTQLVTNFTFVSLPPMDIQPLPAGHVTISWPTATGGFVLQQSSSLAPSSWSDVTTPPATVDGFYQVTLPAAAGNTFYRLINNP